MITIFALEDSPEIKLWVAYIAAAASLISVLVNVLLTRSGERKRREHDLRMANQKEEHDKKLEALRSEIGKEVKRVESQLSDQNSERSARRDYEYEARKRLYTEVEPVLFQLVELSEAALHRIYSLARTARHGNLSDPKTGWLEEDTDYYYRSTVYHLMAPLAAVKLLQRRITFVDLSVERSIAAEYALAKRLLVTFTDDYDFAGFAPKLEYNPNDDGLYANADQKRKLLREDPEKYWRQGMFIGIVEGCADSLLTEAADGRPARVKSISEFDAAVKSPDSQLFKAMEEIRYLFLHFHPARRPVLWRILVAQACIYRTFVELRDAKLGGLVPSDKPLKLIPQAEIERLEWRSKPNEASDEDVLLTPLRVSAQYFRKHSPHLIEDTAP